MDQVILIQKWTKYCWSFESTCLSRTLLSSLKPPSWLCPHLFFFPFFFFPLEYIRFSLVNLVKVGFYIFKFFKWTNEWLLRPDNRPKLLEQGGVRPYGYFHRDCFFKQWILTKWLWSWWTKTSSARFLQGSWGIMNFKHLSLSQNKYISHFCDFFQLSYNC